VITELEFKSLAAQGYNRIPLHRRGLRRPRDAAVAVPQACRRQRAQLPAGIGGGRRALRPLLLHRPAGAHAAARQRLVAPRWCTDGARRARPTRATRSTSSRATRQRFKVALRPGLPRFCGGLAGLLRLRHRALHRAAPGAHLASPAAWACPTSCCCRREELAVIDNLCRPAVPHRLRRPAAARGLLPGQAPPAPSSATSCAIRSPRRPCARGPPTRWSASSTARPYLACGGARPRTTSPRATCMQVQIGQRLQQALHREPAVAVPRAALAQPLALHVLLRLGRLPDRGRLARRSWCARSTMPEGAQGHDPPAGRHAPARGHARAATSAARGRAARPTPRSAPST
jgi:anthranilate synthase component 1